MYSVDLWESVGKVFIGRSWTSSGRLIVWGWIKGANMGMSYKD